MTWGISISGGGETLDCSASCWYGPKVGPSKSASFSGDLDDVKDKSFAFIKESHAEEVAASVSESSTEEPAAEAASAEE
jgi:hypothetical protein